MFGVRVPPDDLVPAPPHVVGPTWRQHENGEWWLPEWSLGWGVLDWMAEYLRDPNDVDKPFLPTLEQARFLLWWYAVDENGRYAYRSGVLRRLKGWGKDPLAAAMSLVELCGPVAFSHFDRDGEPVGKRRASPWIQVAAVSQDQTKNTFTVFPSLLTKKVREEYGLDVNKTIIYARDGGQIEAVTSSPTSIEGGRPTLVILNEIQWWTEANAGHDMYQVVEGNMTKGAGRGARYLAICNAHRPGEDSIGQRLWDTYQKVQAGDAIDTGLLYDALEAPADTPVSEIPHPDLDPEGHEEGLEALRRGLEVARGDAWWLEIEPMVESLLDANNDVIEGRRKYLNQVNATEDSWLGPQEWDRAFRPVKLERRDRITLGFDGSKSSDWTALVACRVDDGAIFVIKVWDPAKYGGQVPRDDVDATVRWAFARYTVVGFRADVREFEAYVDQWGADFGKKLKVKATPGHAVAFDMRGQVKRFALDCERFQDAVFEVDPKRDHYPICHNNDAILKLHILAAHKNPTVYDAISIRKKTKDSSNKIDAAVCAVLAYGARQDFLMSKKSRSGRVVVLP